MIDKTHAVPRDQIPEYRKRAAERLRQARSVVARSQADVARKLGVSPMRWFRYETGERELNFEVLARFCVEYDVCPRWIVIGDMKCMPPDIKNDLYLAYPEIKEAQERQVKRRPLGPLVPPAPRYAAKQSRSQGISPEPGEPICS